MKKETILNIGTILVIFTGLFSFFINENNRIFLLIPAILLLICGAVLMFKNE